MLITDIDNLYEFIFNNVKDIILFIAENGQILDANKTAIGVYGFSHEELTSMFIQDIRHDSMDSDYIDYRTLHEEDGVMFEGIHIKKDGSAFPIEVNSKLSIINGHKFRINIIRDITNRKRIEDELIFRANYDPLTKVANRANIILQIENAIERAKFSCRDLACIVLDIDKFKFINDNFGHIVGDKVLQYVAQSIKKYLRTYDSIGRFGGDEFVILLQNVQSKNNLVSVATRICNIFKYPIIIEDNSIKINVSMGIALLSDVQGTENKTDGLIRQADSAMYEAKKTQGCKFEFFKKP